MYDNKKHSLKFIMLYIMHSCDFLFKYIHSHPGMATSSTFLNRFGQQPGWVNSLQYQLDPALKHAKVTWRWT